MHKKTSQNIAHLSSKVLRDPNSSKVQKELAWSALSQYKNSKTTSECIEDIAQGVLLSPKYSRITKSLAGSVFSQSN